MVRAARLDSALYPELRTDDAANREAIAALAIASVASAFGVGLAAEINDGGVGFFGGLLVGLLGSVGGWLVWVSWSYWFGTAVFWGPIGQDTYRELWHKEFMRSLAFANSPRVLSFLLFIPYVGWIIAVLASVWALAAAVVAARSVFDLSMREALVSSVVGWVPYTLFVLLAAALTI
jgi:hypothetical protein